MSYQQQNQYEDHKRGYDQNPHISTYSNHENHPNDSQGGRYKRSQVDHRSSGYDQRGSRFQEYHKKKSYKYNFFSMFDEQWNRCCEFGNCGGCPTNECIAKRQPKMDWL